MSHRLGDRGVDKAHRASALWVVSEVKVAQLCLTLCDPLDYTVLGVLQTRILEWIAFPFSRGSSQPRDRTQVSYIAGGFFTSRATREALKWVLIVASRIFFFFLRVREGLFYILFIFGCAGSLLLHRLFSNCGKPGLRSSCTGFSNHVGSLVSECKLQVVACGI